MVLIFLTPYLLVLLLTLPAAFCAPTSPNDPLRHIALSRLKPPEDPVCCLQPLTPLEAVQDELLLSFEEWKARQLSAHLGNKEKQSLDPQSIPSFDAPGSGSNRSIYRDVVNGSDYKPSEADSEPSSSSTADPNRPAELEIVSPHFRVPITDRFNYASLECSARVHTSHRSAQSAWSILSSKRDRYMLSPCVSAPKQQETQFVVVELCEDIRIDTVQLANFEFFSGVFKDFTVSVAKTYTTDAEGWTNAGTYRAKNVRGVQVNLASLTL
jgi:hypothetical protein